MPNDVTRITPARLLYGYEVRTPAYTMRELWHKVQEREEERKRAYKRRYDELVYPRTFEVGDFGPMRDQVPAGKLDARWIGPMTVVRANRTGTYHLTGPFGGRLIGAVNGDNLKPWVERAGMTPEVQSARAAERQLLVYRQRLMLHNLV